MKKNITIVIASLALLQANLITAEPHAAPPVQAERTTIKQTPLMILEEELHKTEAEIKERQLAISDIKASISNFKQNKNERLSIAIPTLVVGTLGMGVALRLRVGRITKAGEALTEKYKAAKKFEDLPLLNHADMMKQLTEMEKQMPKLKERLTFLGGVTVNGVGATQLAMAGLNQKEVTELEKALKEAETEITDQQAYIDKLKLLIENSKK